MLSFSGFSQHPFSIYNTSSGVFVPTNLIEASPNLPSSTSINTQLFFGKNFPNRLNRAVFYGGNLGVSQSNSIYGTYLGKWSLVGTWQKYIMPGIAIPGPIYVTPGVNYLVNYHRWGNYAAHFGLRERVSDVGAYTSEETPPVNANVEIKDAVITFAYEKEQTPSRLIFQAIEGVDESAYPSGATHVSKEFMTLLHNGNLGLGISNPAAQFAIKPLSGATQKLFSIFDGNAVEKFTVTDIGRVGINNNTPTADFNVKGDITFEGANFLVNNSTSIQLPPASSPTDQTLKINDHNGVNNVNITDEGKIFLNSYKTGADRALFIKADGEIYTAAANVPNQNQVWLSSGNTFTGTVSSYTLGTYSDHDIDLVVGGKTRGHFIGTGTSKKGYFEYRYPSAIGGSDPLSAPPGTGWAEANPDFAITLKTVHHYSGTQIPNINAGVLECLDQNSASIFKVTNKGTQWYNGLFSILPGSTSGTFEFISGGDILPKNDDVYNLGNGGHSFASLTCTDIHVGNIEAKGSFVNLKTTMIPINASIALGDQNSPFAKSWSVQWWSTSDGNQKENIKNLNKGLDLILKLRPTTYNFINYDQDKLQIGFIAQEVEKVIPEMVCKPSKKGDMYALNYNGFIPILTKAIQEQQVIIDSLAVKLEYVQNVISQKVTLNENKPQNVDLNQHSILFQNHPNPFNGYTFIDYFVPNNAANGFIKITDNNGKLIQAFALTQLGYGQVKVDCTNLTAGTYHYSLLVNSETTNTKTMVLTANH